MRETLFHLCKWGQTGFAINRGYDFFHCPFGYYSFSLAKIRTGEQFGGCGFMNGILLRKPETFAQYRCRADLFSTHPTVIQTEKV